MLIVACAEAIMQMQCCRAKHTVTVLPSTEVPETRRLLPTQTESSEVQEYTKRLVCRLQEQLLSGFLEAAARTCCDDVEGAVEARC